MLNLGAMATATAQTRWAECWWQLQRRIDATRLAPPGHLQEQVANMTALMDDDQLDAFLAEFPACSP
jgi:hypothetical protein